MTGTHENDPSTWDQLVRLNAAAAAPSADFQSFRAFCEKHGVGPDLIPASIYNKYGLGLLDNGKKPKEVQKILREIRADLKRLKGGTDLIPPRRPKRKGRTGARQAQFEALPVSLRWDIEDLQDGLYAGDAPASFGVKMRLLLTMIGVLNKAGFKVFTLDQLFSREAFKVLREHKFGKDETLLIDDTRYQFSLVARRYHGSKKNAEMVQYFKAMGKGAGKLKRSVAPSTLERVGQLNPENWREIQKTCILSLEAAATEPRSREKQLKARDALFGTLVCISARSRMEVSQARFANPIDPGNNPEDDAALLIGGVPVPLGDRHNQAISLWRRSKTLLTGRDDRWVFARTDGTLPNETTFSVAIKKFGATFGIDMTPQSLKLESIRRMKELGIDDAAIQAHLGVTQSINYETRFKVLGTITTANKFVSKVVDGAKKKKENGDAD